MACRGSKGGAGIKGHLSSRLAAATAQAARPSPVGSVHQRRHEAGRVPKNDSNTTADQRGGTEYKGASLGGLHVEASSSTT